MATFVATDPQAYEGYVGRGSQRLAPAFVRFAGVAASERALDIGCGTGHLTRAIAAVAAVATGIDLSAPYVDFARRVTANPAITFLVGDALDLPFEEGVFERSLSMLALDVLPGFRARIGDAHARVRSVIDALVASRKVRDRSSPNASNIHWLEMSKALAETAFERGRQAGIRVGRWQDGRVPVYANTTILRRPVEEYVRLFLG